MRNAVVVDTSIVIKWVLEESDSDIAETLLAEWSSKGIVMLAPALLAYEVSNALYRKARKGEIPRERPKEALAEVLLTELELDFPQDASLSMRAIELAERYNLPATYDAHYLALAEREDCELWTADLRLWNTIKGKLDRVRWLGDYSPSRHEEG